LDACGTSGLISAKLAWASGWALVHPCTVDGACRGPLPWFGTAAQAQVPELGASGAIAAVLGAYFVLYPGSRVRTYIVPVFLVQIPAWVFLGLWCLYQLIEANFGLFSASANGGGVAFFAHVGGFVFGLLAARVLTGTGRIVPQTQ